jgi:Mor family transcriptional regulator
MNNKKNKHYIRSQNESLQVRRNNAIRMANESGSTPEQLADIYKLSVKRIREIISGYRCRRG